MRRIAAYVTMIRIGNDTHARSDTALGRPFTYTCTRSLERVNAHRKPDYVTHLRMWVEPSLVPRPY